MCKFAQCLSFEQFETSEGTQADLKLACQCAAITTKLEDHHRGSKLDWVTSKESSESRLLPRDVSSSDSIM